MSGPSRLDRLLDNDLRTISYVLRNLGSWQDRLLAATRDGEGESLQDDDEALADPAHSAKGFG